MSAAATETRLLTPTEIGQAVKMIRTIMGWSQETLAELSGLTTRTVQRVESGQPSSIDTRRAIARAFGCEDIDFFSRPTTIPSLEQAKAQKEAFDREHLVLPAEVVDGRAIINRLLDAKGFRAIGPGSTVDLTHAVQDAFAAVLDFLRDCMDIADDVSRVEMLGYGDTIEDLAAALREAGFCLCAAVRNAALVTGDGKGQTPMPTTIIYVVAAPADQAPKHIAVPRRVSGGL